MRLVVPACPMGIPVARAWWIAVLPPPHPPFPTARPRSGLASAFHLTGTWPPGVAIFRENTKDRNSQKIAGNNGKEKRKVILRNANGGKNRFPEYFFWEQGGGSLPPLGGSMGGCQVDPPGWKRELNNKMVYSIQWIIFLPIFYNIFFSIKMWTTMHCNFIDINFLLWFRVPSVPWDPNKSYSVAFVWVLLV